MKLGFVTACLPEWNLEQLVKWAAANNYKALEVAAWPNYPQSRPFTAAHIDVDTITPAKADDIKELVATHGIEISSLCFHNNPLDADPTERADMHEHLHKVIDAAALVGSPTVGTFVGRDYRKSVKENLAEAEELFKPFVDHAGQKGIKLVIENCVMEGWHPDGYPGNLAYAPELWEWMFDQGLYLNFDPSHLMWIGIDPVAVVTPYIDKIAHAQAKDIQLFPEKRNRWGTFGKSLERDNPWDVGWWRYRVPGLGQVDWLHLIDALYEGGYAGVLSVEHEDPVWGGNEEKIQVGLEIAQKTLTPLLFR